ncbi:unnamed protein product, partial [Allacma fusca]
VTLANIVAFLSQIFRKWNKGLHQKNLDETDDKRTGESI